MTLATATRRKKAAPPSSVRVAIYCRQSVTDDKDFGSLEAQREAVEGGYECDGVVYRSLSAVAKAVTGSHWSGRRFFGLTQRKKR